MPKQVHRFDSRLNFSLRQVTDYCEAHTDIADPLLQELERETHLKTLAPQMISGPLQGQLLRFLSYMLKPRYALEIGTFTGYGTLCLAAGVPPGGKLVSIEVNPELRYLAEKYVEKSGLSDRVELVTGDAAELIPRLEPGLELVFMDAGKHAYETHYELVMEKIKPGGFLLADNVLWNGKVVTQPEDADAQLLHQFNQRVQADERVENVLLPFRDGLMMVRKKY